MHALETVAVRCGQNGRTSVQNAPSSTDHDLRRDKPSVSVADTDINYNSVSGDSYSIATNKNDPQGQGFRFFYPAAHDRHLETDGSAGDGCSADDWRDDHGSSGGVNCSRGAGGWRRQPGATAFALRVADAYSRDDSRTIVRRAGAARVAGRALDLLRGLLTESRGRDGQERVSYPCVDEFCSAKVRSCCFGQ